jgi:DNA-directed RNA polymerase specialized sigma24 family protein
MPIRDIAAENGMQVSAVKTSLMRTRRKLAEDLEKEGLL